VQRLQSSPVAPRGPRARRKTAGKRRKATDRVTVDAPARSAAGGDAAATDINDHPNGNGRTAVLTRACQQGDLDARTQLVVEHMPLVKTVARHYAGRGEQLDDLVQVGSIGLMKAIERFEPDRGVAFHSYALPTIRGEISHYLRDSCSLVRTSSRLRDLRSSLVRISDDLRSRLERAPTPAEVAFAAGVDESRVVEAFRAQPALIDNVDDLEVQAVDPFEGSEDRATLSAAMRTLTELERRVVYRRFFEDSTQGEIARELGVSQMQVSRLIRKAVEKMREVLEE
jgi:RNA polymerase sigma-B factor